MRGEEILLHTGPPVSTPASAPVTPYPESRSPKMIQFQREFFIDRERLASLPGPTSESEQVPVSATEAIRLAKSSVDPERALRSFTVTEVRLLKGPQAAKRQVEYYLLSMLANGSEVHRIVLMNGQLLSSKLREVK